MKREPQILYRLWCGRKRYSPWLPSRGAAFAAGLPHRVTFQDGNSVHLGPLAWIEKGQRRYPRSKTVSLGQA